ncbi:helix-turn-helix domain-containing protein [Cupriavidus basilensis]|nr:helix-turn-helix domain-containing protein [Cupriavidus basilensis]
MPPEIALLHKILQLGQTLGGNPGMRVTVSLTAQAHACPPCDVLVLWEPPPAAATAAGHLDARIDAATYVIVIGNAVPWLLRTRWSAGMRIALHWHDAMILDTPADKAILSPAIIEHTGKWTTCCGGMACIDLGLGFVRDVLGTQMASAIQDLLCIERIRAPEERQRVALQTQFSGLAPKLSEAVALMEANIEEPLQAEEIARLVGVSRRQLERLFKQHLNAVPSRYYLEIRLERARRLLRESRHSLLQIGLMCGFSSGSHFSAAYRTVFGLTPREERQRMLRPAA